MPVGCNFLILAIGKRRRAKTMESRAVAVEQHTVRRILMLPWNKRMPMIGRFIKTAVTTPGVYSRRTKVAGM
jgi:hypothetical protein